MRKVSYRDLPPPLKHLDSAIDLDGLCWLIKTGRVYTHGKYFLAYLSGSQLVWGTGHISLTESDLELVNSLLIFPLQPGQPSDADRVIADQSDMSPQASLDSDPDDVPRHSAW